MGQLITKAIVSKSNYERINKNIQKVNNVYHFYCIKNCFFEYDVRDG